MFFLHFLLPPWMNKTLRQSWMHFRQRVIASCLRLWWMVLSMRPAVLRIYRSWTTMLAGTESAKSAAARPAPERSWQKASNGSVVSSTPGSAWSSSLTTAGPTPPTASLSHVWIMSTSPSHFFLMSDVPMPPGTVRRMLQSSLSAPRFMQSALLLRVHGWIGGLPSGLLSLESVCRRLSQKLNGGFSTCSRRHPGLGHMYGHVLALTFRTHLRYSNDCSCGPAAHPWDYISLVYPLAKRTRPYSSIGFAYASSSDGPTLVARTILQNAARLSTGASRSPLPTSRLCSRPAPGHLAACGY